MSDREKLFFELIKSHKFEDLREELIKIKEIKENINENIDINIRDETNNYLINYAIIFNRIDILKILLEIGARIDILDNDGRTVLYYPVKFGYTNIIKEILEFNKNIIGLSIHDIKDESEHIPIHYAIRFNNIEALKLFIEYGSNLSIADDNGYNSLHLSIFSRSIEIVKIITNKRIDSDTTLDINSKTKTGDTALHIACNLQEKEIVEILLKNDEIEINAQDFENEFTPLIYAVNLSNFDIVNILLENGANVNLQDGFGNTVVHYSVIEDNIKILSRLVEFDPNLNLWNTDGKTPLHQAFSSSDKNLNTIINLLINKTNLNIQDNDGNTCLHLICRENMWKDFKSEIVKKKLNILLKNKEGIRVIDYINKKDIDEFIELVAEAYLYRLVNKNMEWNEEWEQICRNNLDMKENELEILKKKYDKINDSKPEKKSDLCMGIIRNKIKKLITEEPQICSYKSFPVHKGYLCLSVGSDQNIGVCTFTGSTLDILIGLIYLLDKHKNTCSTLSKKFVDNSDLCNFYRSMGILVNTKCEFLNFEVIWVYKKLHFSENFEKNFTKCIANQDIRFILMPLGIELREGSHANYLIYDKKTNEIERFEPHGANTPPKFNYSPKVLDDILEEKFKEMEPKIKYIRPQDYLPKIGFQIMDVYEYKKKRIGDPGGFCALWSIWYADMRVTYENLERKKLVEIMINTLKEKNISFKNMIRNYGMSIIKIRDEILERANTDINDWINEQVTDKQIETVTMIIQDRIINN